MFLINFISTFSIHAAAVTLIWFSMLCVTSYWINFCNRYMKHVKHMIVYLNVCVWVFLRPPVPIIINVKYVGIGYRHWFRTNVMVYKLIWICGIKLKKVVERYKIDVLHILVEIEYWEKKKIMTNNVYNVYKKINRKIKSQEWKPR